MMNHAQKAEAVEAFGGLDHLEKLIFLGGMRACAAKRITFQDFERDVRRLIDKHREGQAVSVADLPVEWMHPH